jgi:hypothetical protein
MIAEYHWRISCDIIESFLYPTNFTTRIIWNARSYHQGDGWKQEAIRLVPEVPITASEINKITIASSVTNSPEPIPKKIRLMPTCSGVE